MMLAMLCASSLATTVRTPAPSAVAPCPRRQLLTYVAHTAGGGATGAAVYARPVVGSSSTDEAGAEWQLVGRVAAGTTSAADDGPDALIRATQLQRRLVAEHACRLYTELRAAKRGDGIELGVEVARGVAPVPPSTPGDVSVADMLTAGFVGAVPESNSEARRPMKGIYADFAAAGGPAPYVRERVRAELDALLEPSRRGDGPAVIIFAWRSCGYATKARRALDERRVPYSDVVVDKYGSMHAELALVSGRPSVPCIYVRGQLIGGFEGDAQCPGLLGSWDAIRGT